MSVFKQLQQLALYKRPQTMRKTCDLQINLVQLLDDSGFADQQGPRGRKSARSLGGQGATNAGGYPGATSQLQQGASSLSTLAHQYLQDHGP